MPKYYQRLVEIDQNIQVWRIVTPNIFFGIFQGYVKFIEGLIIREINFLVHLGL